MGQIAAQTVVDRIEGRGEFVEQIAIEPEFVVRASSGPVPSRSVQNALDESRLSLEKAAR
jgi:hypothetical protein